MDSVVRRASSDVSIRRYCFYCLRVKSAERAAHTQEKGRESGERKRESTLLSLSLLPVFADYTNRSNSQGKHRSPFSAFVSTPVAVDFLLFLLRRRFRLVAGAEEEKKANDTRPPIGYVNKRMKECISL